MDRDSGKLDFNRVASNSSRLSPLQSQSSDSGARHPESVECIKQPRSSNINRENTDGCSALCSGEFVADGARVQKRRSRWNEAEDSNLGKYAPLHKEPRIHSESVQVSNISLLYGNSGVPSDQAAIINEEKHNNLYVNRSPNRMTIKYLNNNEQSIDEDVPPGFSPPHKASFVPSSASATASTFCQEKCLFPEYPFEVAVGHPQERFVSRSPVSFGIPMHAVEHFGRQGEIAENWFVAAGIPFHPYPPLPPYPLDRRGPAPALSSMILNSVPVIGEGFQNNATYQSDQITFSTSASCMPDLELSAPVKQHHFQGTGGASNRLERRYFRQQKWINTKSRPPWVRGEAGRGNFGNI